MFPDYAWHCTPIKRMCISYAIAEASVGGRAQFGVDKRSITFWMTIEELTPPTRVV
jgi:hypothetical protein